MATVAKVISSNLNIVDDYSKRFFRVAPQKFPSASRALCGDGAPMEDLVVRWGQKNALQTRTQLNGDIDVDGDGAETTITFDSTEGMRVGTRLLSIRTGEVMHIASGITSTQAVVTRGVAAETGGVFSTLLDNDVIIIMPNAPDESMAYSNAPTALMYSPDDIYNEMQTFLEPIKLSNRVLALVERGRLKYQEAMKDKRFDALERLKGHFNLSLIEGRRATVAGADGVRTQTGGLIWHALTNNATDGVQTSVGDFSNPITFENTVKDTCLKAGKPSLRMLCSPSAFQSNQRLYQGGSLGNYSGEWMHDEVGVRINKIHTPWGVDLDCYLDFMFADACVSSVWQGRALIWDPEVVKWRPNQPTGKYEPPPTSADYTEWMMGEGGWELGPSNSVCYITGITKPT